LNKTKHYLLIRPGAIGDAIVTLPAVQALKAAGHAVDLVVGGTAAMLLRGRCVADAVHSYEEPRWAALFAPALPDHAAAFLASFEGIVLYLACGYTELAGRLAAQIAIPVIGWPCVPDEAHPMPISDHLQQPLRKLGVTPASMAPKLALTVPDRTFAEAWWQSQGLGPESGIIMALHPGSGSTRKNWPLTRYKELAALLKARYAAQLLIVLGPAEAELRDHLTRWETISPVVAQGLHLAQIAGLLTRCRCLIGNDSGIAHLAAALGVPTVALFGPTDPRVWAPRGKLVRIVTTKAGEAMAAITVTQVAQAVKGVFERECAKK
jgi:ADP-heptose:LPS heptosyltransferase